MQHYMLFKPLTPQMKKRTLSRRDVNRRRFMSQESVDSIQAMIAGLEKQRAIQK